jgi:hypothetical protein
MPPDSSSIDQSGVQSSKPVGVFKQIWNTFASVEFSLPLKRSQNERQTHIWSMIRAFLRELGIIRGFVF